MEEYLRSDLCIFLSGHFLVISEVLSEGKLGSGIVQYQLLSACFAYSKCFNRFCSDSGDSLLFIQKTAVVA